MNTQNNNVSIGPSTLAGWGTALTAFLAAAITYLTGDHSAQSVTAVELAGIGVLSGGITQLGRYFQAHKNTTATEVIKHVQNTIDSNSDTTLLSEGKKIVSDVDGAIKDPKEVFNWQKDDEIASDIDNIATSATPTIPDGDNSKVAADISTTSFDQQAAISSVNSQIDTPAISSEVFASETGK